MKSPTTYRAWVKQQGTVKELGVKTLILDRMLRKLDKANIPSLIAPTIATVISKGFVDNGVRPPPSFEQWIERDPALRGLEYGVLIDGVQGHLPIEYLSVAYHAWQKCYGEIKQWEDRSLTEYLEHWWLHRKGPKHLRQRVESLLDELKPGWRD